MIRIFVIVSLWLLSSTVFAKKIQITVETDIYHLAETMLKGSTPQTIERFDHALCQRDAVEYILVQRALSLGGFHHEFEFHLGNFDARNIKMLTKGILLVSFDTIWLSHASQFQDQLFISKPVIRKGEYIAGVYTSPANKGQLQINSLEDFAKLTVVSSKDWYVDWITLKSMQPKKLIHEPDWLSMAKLVSLGWVDVMLAPFKREYPFRYVSDNFNLVAVEGVKVALQDSRHFVLSRNHPYGEQAFIALQKGLAQLRRSGLIERAYTECGFFNSRVQNWQLLNP